LIVNVTPDEYVRLLESDFVACFNYETEIMAFIDHMSGLLHRQGVVQSDRLLARAGTGPCGASGKAEQTDSSQQQPADAGVGQGQTAQPKDAGAMHRTVYAGHDHAMISKTHCRKVRRIAEPHVCRTATDSTRGSRSRHSVQAREPTLGIQEDQGSNRLSGLQYLQIQREEHLDRERL